MRSSVIVVGGIGVGGSGKTPLVIALVKHLKKLGYKPGVISRGYGGQTAFWPREVDQTTTPELVGDEPQLIFEKCNVPVVVGPDRVRSGCYMIDKLKCNVLISDDGYQHFALKRNIDIVVIDGNSGFGNGWCLPAGPLREPKSAIKRADIVVLNKELDKCLDNSDIKLIQNTQPCSMFMVLGDARNLQDATLRKLSEFSDRSVHAIAGIGNPERFFLQLENSGVNFIRHVFPDHHNFTESDLTFGDDNALIMTEKDGIKCRDMTAAKNMWVVPAELRVDDVLYQRIEDMLPSDNSV